MPSKSIFIKFILPAIIVFILSGCSVKEFAVKGASLQSLEIEGLKVSLLFRNEEELVNSFSKRNNPFLAPPSALGLNRYLVFELSLNTDENLKAPVAIQLTNMEIQFGGQNKSPVNRHQLSSIWEREIMKNDRYRGWDAGRVKNIIKRNIFPNKMVITANSRNKGLLLFKGNFPNYGQATIYVPVFKENGEMVRNFRFSFEF